MLATRLGVLCVFRGHFDAVIMIVYAKIFRLFLEELFGRLFECCRMMDLLAWLRWLFKIRHGPNILKIDMIV